MGFFDVIGDLLVELFVPSRRAKGKPPREPWSVRRSRKRLQRQSRRSD